MQFSSTLLIPLKHEGLRPAVPVWHEMLTVHHIWTAEFHCMAHSNFHKIKAYVSTNAQTLRHRTEMESSSWQKFFHPIQLQMWIIHVLIFLSVLRVTMLNWTKSYKIIMYGFSSVDVKMFQHFGWHWSVTGRSLQFVLKWNSFNTWTGQITKVHSTHQES